MRSSECFRQNVSQVLEVEDFKFGHGIESNKRNQSVVAR